MTERDFFSTGNHTKRPYFVVKKKRLLYILNAFGAIVSSFVRGLSRKLLTCLNGQTSLVERSRSKLHLHMQCLHLKPSEHLKPFSTETVNSVLHTAIFLRMSCFTLQFRFVRLQLSAANLARTEKHLQNIAITIKEWTSNH